MTSTLSAPPNTDQRAAIRRIAAFRQRFGDGHFYLACHAALPLALTPDLLYCLWVNFQQDSHQQLLDIPWIAVSDLILSNLCEEVGYELYEMDASIRNELLKQLKNDSRFGLERLRELADFVMAYIEQELDHPDLDTKELAQMQKLRALAYKQPSEAAHEIVLILTQLKLKDKTEWIRMAALVNGLAEPLSAFQDLLGYIRAMADLARRNLEAATAQMNKAVDANNQVRVEGVNLPIPDIINGMLRKSNEPDTPPLLSLDRLRFPLAIAGGTVISLLVLIGVQYELRSPNPQRTPDTMSSAMPSPQVSPSTFPPVQQTPSPSRSTTSSPSATILPSTLQRTAITPTPSSKAKTVTTRTVSTSTSIQGDTSQQRTTNGSTPSTVVTPAVPPAVLSSPSPSPTSSTLPKLPSAEKEVQALSIALNKVQALRPGEPLLVSPDGQFIASGGRDGILRLWSKNGVLQEPSMKLPRTSPITSMRFSPDGKIIVGIGANYTTVWNLVDKRVTLRTDMMATNSVVFSPDAKLLAASRNDGIVQLWDSNGSSLVTLRGYEGVVSSMVFSPDGKLLATSSDDGTVRLWDLSGNSLATLRGNQGVVSSVVFSPDGKLLATSSDDGTARLWDLTGKQLAVFPNAGSNVSFSPDGKSVITMKAHNGGRSVTEIVKLLR